MNTNLDKIFEQLQKAYKEDLRKDLISTYNSAESDLQFHKDYRGLCLLMTYCLANFPTLSDAVWISVESIIDDVKKKKDYALTAIFHLIAGLAYKVDYSNDQARRHFKQAMSKPQLLAKVSMRDYDWLITNGEDCENFDNSLLWFVGIQSESYNTLYEYYKTTGNRTAACYARIKSIEKDEDGYDYEEAKYYLLTQVIEEYNDLPIICETVRYICEYDLLPHTGKIGLEEENLYARSKYEFLMKYIRKFSEYQRIDELKQIVSKIEEPFFELSDLDKVVVPNVPISIPVKFRNTESLTISVYKTRFVGRNSCYDGYERTEKARIKQMWENAAPTPIYNKTYTYDNAQKYLTQESEIEIEGLPLGIYLVELKSNYGGSQINLLHVSRIAAMTERLPDGNTRIVVVDSVNGHPIPYAKADLMHREKADVVKTLVCDKSGEVKYGYFGKFSNSPDCIFPYTDEDRFCIKENIYCWNGYSYREEESTETIEIVTDRDIYRPGQTVHIAIVWYSVDEKKNVKTISRKTELQVGESYGYDYNDHNKVKIETDKMGIAHYDYVIPENGKTGYYNVSCEGERKYFRVEEYKRPTFEVKFEDYKKAYKVGDTVTVEGIATSYAGVPIANAEVHYKVKRALAWWWYSMSRYWGYEGYYHRYAESEFKTGTTKTDAEGRFKVEVPMTLHDEDEEISEDSPLFLSIIAEADVIDTTGELQTGRTHLELSNKEYFAHTQILDKFELSEVFSFNVIAKNASGQDIDKEIEYWFDDQTERTKVKSNITINFDNLGVGKHSLHVKYDNEEEVKDFYIFNKYDLKTPFETEKWSYQSSTVFPEDGGDVILQVGCSTENTYLVYNIFSGNKLLESGGELVSSGMINRRLSYKKEYGGAILISYAWIRNRKMQSQNFTITKPFPNRKLQMSWKTFRDRVTPETGEKWILTVKDYEGKNVSANVIATLYDKSLDQLVNNTFCINGPRLSWNAPSTCWQNENNDTISLRYVDYVERKDYPFAFSKFLYSPVVDIRNVILDNVFEDRVYNSCCEAELSCPPTSARGGTSFTSFNSIVCESDDCFDNAFDEEVTEAQPEVKLRSDMSETAFFMPTLRTDKQGDVSIEFVLPDSLTTWKFKAIAHTQEMYIGCLEDETIARKTVMVQPNMPRFVRVGDETAISAKVTNTSENDISGTAVLELLDAENEIVVHKESAKFELPAGETKPFTFDFTPDEEIKEYICKIYAYGEGFNDGEQHSLPVLTNKAEVTRTYVISQDDACSEDIDVSRLLPDGSTRRHLSLQYTNKPIWLAINALPAMSKDDSENVITISITLYCNLFTDYLQKHASRYGDVDLARPEDLKKSTTKLIEKLATLQSCNGGFRWFKDMPESLWLTSEVLMHLVRLEKFTGKQRELRDIIEKALHFCDREMCGVARDIKKREKDGKLVFFPSFGVLQHMYNCAFSAHQLDNEEKKAYEYLLKLLKKDILEQTIQEKAMTAVILEYAGEHKKALRYAESLRQYTDCNDDGERTFNTSRATYSWHSYKIPTHVAGMETLYLLCPDDMKTIREMQKWLLREKRTQMWETSIDSVNSVHALLLGAEKYLSDNRPTEFYSDGELLEIEHQRNEGFVETDLPTTSKKLTVVKRSRGISWGAVFAQFLQPMSDVIATGSGMTIKREIITDKKELHVGDRIKVKLTYDCERNFDLVTVIDSKAACMEAIQQLSWSDSFVHVQPLDKETRYSYYGLGKGTHSIQTEYYLDRSGVYEIGCAKITCTYAPEFTAVCPSQKLVVLPS